MADSVIRFLFKGDAKGAQDAFKQMGAAAASLDRPPAATPVGPTRPLRGQRPHHPPARLELRERAKRLRSGTIHAPR